MGNYQTRSNQNSEKKKGFNGWKWAFISLAVIIIAGFIYLVSMLQPVSINEAHVTPIERQDERLVLTTSMNKEDTESLINTYLNESIGEDFSGYQVNLTNQLEIHGVLEIFTFNVPFSLYFTPYVLENGHIQLRGQSVRLANFSLPVSGVMSLLTQQVNLPEFIAVDSTEQLIVINLDEMTETFTFDIQVEAIDLEKDDIRVKLYFEKDLILESMQSLNGY